MKLYHLYVSGILYAELDFDTQPLSIQKLDIASAKLLPWETLSEEDNAFYKSFTKIDLLKLSHQLHSYEQKLAGNGEVIVELPEGAERYTSSKDSWYLQRDIKFPNNKLVENGELLAVSCPAREMVTVLVRDGEEDRTVLKMWRNTWPDEKIYGVNHLGSFPVPMRDGIHLSTDVYVPAGLDEKVPAVLIRTPYGKEDGCEVYYRYVQRGYAVVVQDVRGRNLSEGEWIPNHSEVEDGDDTLNWIADQSWSSGSVGMVGGSYLGYVQWAAAASGNPHLKALISVVCAGSAFVDLPRRGGCFTSGMLAWGFAVSQKKFHPELMERDDWEEVLNIRPLDQLAEKALGYRVPFLDKWLENPDYDEFWHRSNWKERSVHAQIPALIQSGWFDDNGMGTTEALELVHDFPEGMRKVILGPWQHSGNSKYDMHGVSFGDEALRFDLDFIYFQWFEHHLKGIDNGIDKTAPVEYYTVGQETWKIASNWPIPETQETEIYLDSCGHANTSSGDGVLSFKLPEKESQDSYDYDPQNPSTHIIDMSENEIEVPEDYTEEEKRQDMLCYSTDPLEKDVVITGDITVSLYIASDAPDTDFMVRLTDVDENGRSIKLADGILSAKYRNGFDHADFLNPGEVVPLTILTTKISNCFKKGHRIRVTITSSAKNFVFPNSNTKDGFNSQTTVVAHNTIFHGGQYPSKITVRMEQ